MQTSGEKKEKKRGFGAHQHFIDATRKNRLTAFGICTDPHDLDIMKFIPPGKVIPQKSQESRALVVEEAHETHLVRRDGEIRDIVEGEKSEKHLTIPKKQSKKVQKQKK